MGVVDIAEVHDPGVRDDDVDAATEFGDTLIESRAQCADIANVGNLGDDPRTGFADQLRGVLQVINRCERIGH